MDGPHTKWIVVGVVAAAALLTGLAGNTIGWQLAGGIAAGLAGATAAFAAIGYRSRRDPALLLLAAAGAAFAWNAGFLPLALGAIPHGVWSQETYRRLVSVETYGLLIGSATVVLCTAFVVPWRDRRGRPPLRVRSVTLAVALPLVLLDAVLLLTEPVPRVVPGVLGRLTGTDATTWRTQIALGVILVVAGLVTSVRTLPRGRWQSWVGGSGIAFAFAGVAALKMPSTSGIAHQLLLTRFEFFMPVAAMAMLVVAVVVTQGAETSRMRRASDRAAAVMEGRAEIASMVAHDVRGPVTTIKGLATTTKNSYGRLGDAERLEFIGMIETESGRLLDLVNQTALALKVDADTLTFDRRSQEIGPIVRMAVDAVDAGTHPVTVEVDPALSAAVDVRWLTEAVRQGVENAVKFSPDGSPIVVRASRDDARASIEIHDAGPGVPQGRRAEVFERFSTWRPEGYEDRPGSALGLFIVRGIARAHGGDASLADAPDGGTILRIAIPTEERTG